MGKESYRRTSKLPGVTCDVFFRVRTVTSYYERMLARRNDEGTFFADVSAM